MNSRKIIFLLFGITIVLLTAILGMYLKIRFLNPPKEVNLSQSSSVPVEDLSTWTDQSGFTFQYPRSLNLNPHEEDKENYAHLELTSPTYKGNLIVWAKDTEASDIEEWAKKSSEKGFIDTVLGGEKAKKLLITQEGQKLVTSTIYGGYLYQIEVNLIDKDYWNKVYETVSSTFKFLSVENQEKIDSDFPQWTNNGESEIYEEKEIIE